MWASGRAVKTADRNKDKDHMVRNRGKWDHGQQEQRVTTWNTGYRVNMSYRHEATGTRLTISYRNRG